MEVFSYTSAVAQPGCSLMQAVDVVLDHDDDDMNPDANGAVVINLGGHHPEDGMVEAGTVSDPFLLYFALNKDCQQVVSVSQQNHTAIMSLS